MIERGESWDGKQTTTSGQATARPGRSLPDLSRPSSTAGMGYRGAFGAARGRVGGRRRPRGLYEGAEAGAMVGIVRQWAAIESWAAAEISARCGP